VQRAAAEHEVELTPDEKAELQDQLGSQTGDAANIAAQALLPIFVADQKREKHRMQIVELCKAEVTLADKEEQKMVAARAAEMEGDAKDAIGKALQLLRAKQIDVNQEVDKVLASYKASLSPHDLGILRRKVTSKVYTAGATVVEAVKRSMQCQGQLRRLLWRWPSCSSAAPQNIGSSKR